MNGRTQTRRAASIAAITAATIVGVATAGADAPKTPAETGIEQLTQAAGDNPDAQAAVQATAKSAQLIAAAKLQDIGFTPFSYMAPTLGCGHNMPFSLAAANAITAGGPDGAIAGPPGTMIVQATVQQDGFPLASGLSVAWLNVNNGRSGITALDDRTDYNLPSLSKTVDSGPGTVVASLWGTIDYPAARCVVLPTVGLFTVPDAPAAAPVNPGDPNQGNPVNPGGPVQTTTPPVNPGGPNQPAAPTTTNQPPLIAPGN
ncbi:hypothetical protein ACIP5Y_13565 [Nocardia sp. NPDC088792]|uniref:hypothetical protein n=1 Tax=Nocardia sp. NPDC088792 TaxID=3364332 RepID=UPI003823E128